MQITTSPPLHEAKNRKIGHDQKYLYIKEVLNFLLMQ